MILVDSSVPRFQIAANTAAQLFGKSISAATTFFATLLIARTLGPEGYGDFVKITTFIGFFFLLTDFGLNAVYLKHEQTERHVGQLIGLRLIVGFGGVFTAIATLALLPTSYLQGFTQSVRVGVIAFAPVIVFQAISTTTMVVFQRTLRYDLATIGTTLGNILTLAFVWLFLVHFGFTSSVSAIGGFVAGACVTTLIHVWYAHRLVPLTVEVPKKAMMRVLIMAIPLGVVLTANVIYAHIDTIILALWRTSAEVGAYGLAYKIFETILVFPTFFMNALYPFFLAHTKDANQSPGAMWLMAKKAAIVLGVVAFLALICTWVGAPLIMQLRSDFSNSVFLLRILAISFPFFFLSALTLWMLIALGKQLFLLVLYVSTMIVNICLNLWLIPRYGASASAWITVSCEGVVLVLSTIYLFSLYSRKSA